MTSPETHDSNMTTIKTEEAMEFPDSQGDNMQTSGMDADNSNDPPDDFDIDLLDASDPDGDDNDDNAVTDLQQADIVFDGGLMSEEPDFDEDFAPDEAEIAVASASKALETDIKPESRNKRAAATAAVESDDYLDPTPRHEHNSNKRIKLEHSDSQDTSIAAITASAVATTTSTGNGKDTSKTTTSTTTTIVDSITPEIWTEIFAYLSPEHLGRLRAVCREFYKLLFNENIWRRSRKIHAGDMPKPVFGLKEWQMWELWKGSGCMLCDRYDGKPKGTGGVRIYWPFRVRCCPECLRENTTKEMMLLKSNALPIKDDEVKMLLPALPFGILDAGQNWIGNPNTYQSNTGMSKVFWNDDVLELKERYDDAKDMNAAEEWLKGLESEGQAHRADADRMDRWETRVLSGSGTKAKAVVSSTAAAATASQQPQPIVSLGNTNWEHNQKKDARNQQQQQQPQQLQQQPPPAAHPQPFAHLPTFSSGSNRHERSAADAAELQAQRQNDIEMRCLKLEPPIHANVLIHCPAFQAAIKIAQPFDDNSWQLLVPKLLNERPEAEKAAKSHQEQQEKLQRQQEERRLLEAKEKDEWVRRERQWEESQGPVRDMLSRIVDLEIKAWEGKIDKESAPRFAADVLINTREKYYKQGGIPEKQETDETNNHDSGSNKKDGVVRKLVLENMKWVFDTKVKPVTDPLRKDLFVCRGCGDTVPKMYGFEGVIQHYAAKHTSDMSLGNVVVFWRSEWPEETPFADPALLTKINALQITAAAAAAAAASSGPGRGQAAGYHGRGGSSQHIRPVPTFNGHGPGGFSGHRQQQQQQHPHQHPQQQDPYAYGQPQPPHGLPQPPHRGRGHHHGRGGHHLPPHVPPPHQQQLQQQQQQHHSMQEPYYPNPRFNQRHDFNHQQQFPPSQNRPGYGQPFPSQPYQGAPAPAPAPAPVPSPSQQPFYAHNQTPPSQNLPHRPPHHLPPHQPLYNTYPQQQQPQQQRHQHVYPSNPSPGPNHGGYPPSLPAMPQAPTIGPHNNRIINSNTNRKPISNHIINNNNHHNNNKNNSNNNSNRSTPVPTPQPIPLTPTPTPVSKKPSQLEPVKKDDPRYPEMMDFVSSTSVREWNLLADIKDLQPSVKVAVIITKLHEAFKDKFNVLLTPKLFHAAVREKDGMKLLRNVSDLSCATCATANPTANTAASSRKFTLPLLLQHFEGVHQFKQGKVDWLVDMNRLPPLEELKKIRERQGFDAEKLAAISKRFPGVFDAPKLPPPPPPVVASPSVSDVKKNEAAVAAATTAAVANGKAKKETLVINTQASTPDSSSTAAAGASTSASTSAPRTASKESMTAAERFLKDFMEEGEEPDDGKSVGGSNNQKKDKNNNRASSPPSTRTQKSPPGSAPILRGRPSRDSPSSSSRSRRTSQDGGGGKTHPASATQHRHAGSLDIDHRDRDRDREKDRDRGREPGEVVRRTNSLDESSRRVPPPARRGRSRSRSRSRDEYRRPLPAGDDRRYYNKTSPPPLSRRRSPGPPPPSVGSYGRDYYMDYGGTGAGAGGGNPYYGYDRDPYYERDPYYRDAPPYRDDPYYHSSYPHSSAQYYNPQRQYRERSPPPHPHPPPPLAGDYGRRPVSPGYGSRRRSARSISPPPFRGGAAGPPPPPAGKDYYVDRDRYPPASMDRDGRRDERYYWR